ncbi:MAG: hypothetical protein AABW87_01880 [Nanoarchaeota archaeon]
MESKFDVLLLHDPVLDRHPRSWISVKADNLDKLLYKMEKKILKEYNLTREALSKDIGRELNCSFGVIKQLFQRKKEYYPIPFLKYIFKKTNQILDINKLNVSFLKVNSASSKPVKFVDKLNSNLARILGAFAADGSLSIQVVIESNKREDIIKIKNFLEELSLRYSIGFSSSRRKHYTSFNLNKDNLLIFEKIILDIYPAYKIQLHYTIELTDEYKDSVESFNKWMESEFGVKPNSFNKRREKKAWRTIYSNKIISRYLTTFFGMNPGPKAYTVKEPLIIEKSSLLIRRAFALGVLMFDGCVKKEGCISFSTRSKNLSNSIRDIFNKDKILFSYSFTDNHHEIRSLNNNRLEKLLKYFEPETQKWKLLRWLSGDKIDNVIIKDGHSISFDKLIKTLDKIGVCDIPYLMNNFNCSYTTIRTYLKILRLHNKIVVSNKPEKINNKISDTTTLLLKKKFHNVIFNKIRNVFDEDKKFAKVLGVHKATLSNWRLRKSKIPLYILKKACLFLKIPMHMIYDNVEKTDRSIIKWFSF